MNFTISRPQKKRKAQHGGEAASPPACAIGTSPAFMIKKSLKKLGCAFGPDLTIIGSLNVNMMLKIEF